MTTKQKIEKIVIKALRQAYKTHQSLGIQGLEDVGKNQFGETSFYADVMCENTVIEVLKQSKLSLSVVSEEHGMLDLASNAQYLAIIDGLDGSGMFKKGRGKNRYATMLGIFSSADPTYNDYLVSGIYEHSTKRLYLAVKGEGAFVIEKGVRTRLKTSGKTTLGADMNIYVDEYFDINRQMYSEPLAEFEPNTGSFYAGTSAAVHFVDVASGAADLNLRCSCKMNLEPAIAYAFMAETGGVIVDKEGNSVGDKKYFEFGQNSQIPIITAATKELAEDLIDFLHRN